MKRTNRERVIGIVLVALVWPMIAVGQEDLRELVRAVKPSVVTIGVFDSTGKPLGMGSGFFIDDEHIITARHVVESASYAEFRTSDGGIHSIAGVVADDRWSDLAMLRVAKGVNAKPLTVASAGVEVGEAVVAIGSPFGLDLTVSNGIVSSIRPMPQIGMVLQITAPISPGSSGGPILNRSGEVVGVASAVFAEGQNLNFAVPASRIGTLQRGNPVAFQQWRAAAAAQPHAMLPPDAPEYLRDSGTVRFLSDYAFDRGQAMMEARQYEAAIEMLSQSLHLFPNRPDGWYRMGMCEMSISHYDHAAKSFAEGMRYAPYHVHLSYRYGLSLLYLKKQDEAIATLRKTVGLDSTFAPAWYALGEELGQQGKEQEAHPCLQRAVQLQPKDPQYRLGLAFSFTRLEDYGKAIPEFTTALRLDSNLTDAEAGLGVSLNRVGRNRESLLHLQRALAERPKDPELNREYGLALYTMDRCSEAEKFLKTALQLRPDDGSAHYYLGNVQLCQKQVEKAIGSFKESIRFDPDNPLPHFALGMTYVEHRRDKSAALDEYKILQKVDATLAKELFDTIYR